MRTLLRRMTDNDPDSGSRRWHWPDPAQRLVPQSVEDARWFRVVSNSNTSPCYLTWFSYVLLYGPQVGPLIRVGVYKNSRTCLLTVIRVLRPELRRRVALWMRVGFVQGRRDSLLVLI